MGTTTIQLMEFVLPAIFVVRLVPPHLNASHAFLTLTEIHLPLVNVNRVPMRRMSLFVERACINVILV
jgi:hypothetical protein